jgi:hypothetical protein
VLHDRQAQAGAAPDGTRSRCIHLVEALEDALQVLWRDADAVVLDAQHHRGAILFGAEADRHPSAGRGKLDGVLDEVSQDQVEQPAVTFEGHRRIG